MRVTKKQLIVLFLLIIVVIGGLIVFYPTIKYNKALSFLDDNEFDKAITLFEELDDYKRSEEMVVKSYYEYAIYLLDQEQYSEAAEIIEELESSEENTDLTNETKYLLAKGYMKVGNYMGAKSVFEEITKYKDSEKLLIEAKYSLAKQYFDTKKYTKAKNILKEISDYKDASELLQETAYLQGKEEYLSGNFHTANNLFTSLADYKDSETYAKNSSLLDEMEGTWESEGGLRQLTIDGWNLYQVYFPNSYKTSVFEYEYELVNTELRTPIDDSFSLANNGIIVEKDDAREVEETYKKIDNYASVPNEKSSPRIGMSEQELLNSNWGPPQDINRTTTAYGVNEQWVYSGYRYIYLEDGIVTGIQE